MPLKIGHMATPNSPSLFWAEDPLSSAKKLRALVPLTPAQKLYNSITRDAFDYGVLCFKNYFTLAVPGPLDWSAPMVIEVKTLKDLMAAAGEGILGITLYHGLNEEDRLVHGFRVVKLELDGTGETYDLVPPLHEGIGATPDLVLNALGRFDDMTALGGPLKWLSWSARYYDRMRLVRSPGVPEKKPDRAHDPKAITFLWADEIERLIEDNGNAYPGLPLRMMLSNFSLYHMYYVGGRAISGPEGFRHGVCFHMQAYNGTEWYDLLQNGDEVTVYADRAADIGHLCPPRCRKIPAYTVAGAVIPSPHVMATHEPAS